MPTNKPNREPVKVSVNITIYAVIARAPERAKAQHARHVKAMALYK